MSARFLTQTPKTAGWIAALLLVAALVSGCKDDEVALTGKVPTEPQVQAGASAPQVSITANGVAGQLIITAGQTVTIAWTSVGAQSCTPMSSTLADPQPQAQPSWGNDPIGSHDIVPPDQMTFIAQCMNADGMTGTAQVTVYVSPTCDNKTVIKLTSSEFTNKAAGQFIDYEVSFTDCTGNPLPVPAQQIWFDMDAYNSGNTTELPYTFFVNGAATDSGVMDLLSGEDLFGHVGQDYGHFLTDAKVAVPSSVASFHLQLDVSQVEMHAISSDLNNPPAEETVPTFLRIGSSQPDVATIKIKNLP